METNNKLREALELAKSTFETFIQFQGDERFVKCWATLARDAVIAALAEPPRNCDRFASAEEAWDAYDEWVESYRAKGETEPLNEFGWLFAPATTPNQNTQEEN